MKLNKNKNNTNFIICNLTESVANRITNYHVRDVIDTFREGSRYFIASSAVVLNLFRMTEHLTFYEVFAEHIRKIKQLLY